jgi:hypothetical protein
MMKDFRQIRLDESNELVEDTNSLISEEVQDITEALSIIAQRIADEEISNRLIEIAEELGLYNKYFTISESCILNEYDSGLLPAIAESYRTGDSFEYTYPDGEVVEIDTELSESIVDIYDNLDEENRNIFAALVSESADNLEDVLNHFAEDEEDEDEINENRLAGLRDDERRPERSDDTPEDNLMPKQGLKIAKDRKAYLARKAAEADAKRKAAGGLKKEDLEVENLDESTPRKWKKLANSGNQNLKNNLVKSKVSKSLGRLLKKAPHDDDGTDDGNAASVPSDKGGFNRRLKAYRNRLNKFSPNSRDVTTKPNWKSSGTKRNPVNPYIKKDERAKRKLGEDLEGDTNTISEKPVFDGDRPSKKNGPSTRDLAKQARWLKKTGIDKNATVKNKKGC